ncbi:MAG: TIGR03545 family protein [Spirochaetales bacterium]|nr:TIGR03545 family protein [Spirochaetales bacterium]
MKKNKIPGLFRKQYKIKAFNSKIVKRIHIPKDQEIIKNLFVKNSNGKMEIIKDIPKDVLLKLKPLSKSIKKNRGMVSRWKLIIVLFIIASILIFNIFFKDRLLTQGIEKTLESIFQADVEIRELNFSLLKGSISYNSLTIADADNNMQNLLETGPSEFRIDMKELSKKRVKIEEMSMTGVMWDSPRMDDGALDNSGSTESDGSNEDDSKVFEVLALDSGEFDIEALLEDQKSNLTSLNLINQGNEEIDAFTQKWEGVYSEKDKEIEELETDVEELKLLTTQNTGTIKEGQVIALQIKDLYPRVTDTKDGLVALQHDFKEDKNSLMDLKKSINNAVDDDIAYLNGMLNLTTSDIGSLASDAAEKYIRNRWNDYYEKALKAFEIYEKFQINENKELTDEKVFQRDSGRNIYFPSPDNPGFLIEHILLSGGGGLSGSFTSEIRSLSNEPDKLNEGSSFLVNFGSAQSTIKLDGILDLRTDSEIPFLMEIESPGNFLSMEEGIAVLNISNLNSNAEFIGESKTSKEKNTVITTLDIILTEIEIEQENEEGFLSEAVKDILSDMNSIDLRAEIGINRDGLETVKVLSDLDDILSERIGGYIKDKADDTEEELRVSLEEYLSSSLEDNQTLQSSLAALDVKSLDQISSVNNMENQVNKLKSDAEKKTLDETTKLLDQVTDKIKLPGF